MKCGCDPHVEWCPECRQVKVDQANRDRGWVKCADQMPTDDKSRSPYVLTWDGHHVIENRLYWDCLFHRWAWLHHNTPTHWMPLPKPPTVQCPDSITIRLIQSRFNHP